MSGAYRPPSAHGRAVAGFAVVLLAVVGGCAHHPDDVIGAGPTSTPTTTTPLPTPGPSTVSPTRTSGHGGTGTRGGHTSASPSDTTASPTPSATQITGQPVYENFSIKAATNSGGGVDCYWTASPEPGLANVYVPLVIGHTGGIPLHGPKSVQFRLSYAASESVTYVAPFATGAYDLPVREATHYYFLTFTAQLLLNTPDAVSSDNFVHLQVEVDAGSPPASGSEHVSCAVTP